MGLIYYTNKTSRRPQVVSVAHRLNMRWSPELMARMGCKACPLDLQARHLKSPKMKPTGTTNPLLYVMGEAPGVEEDKGDEQFIGRSGELARSTLRKALKLRSGQDENEFVRWNNAIRCHPEGNRDPTPGELMCCTPKQTADIADVRPKVVLALGATALDALIGERHITAWRGRQIATLIEDHPCWVVPTHHPAFILRAANAGGFSKQERQQKDLKRFFETDIKLAVALAQFEPPPSTILRPANVLDGVQVISDFPSIISALNRWESGEFSATDIETTGYRPYHDGARILSASLSDGEKTISFPISHPEALFSVDQQTRIHEAYGNALRYCKAVYAHNLNMEFEWFCWYYGPQFIYEINGHDTMAQAYILDERSGALALDDLCRIHLGLKIKELSDLDKSDLINEPLDRLLPYNGIDAKATALVAKIQHKYLCEEALDAVYDRHRQRSRSLVIMQFLGVTPDCDEADRLDEKYASSEKEIIARAMAHADVVAYERKTGEGLSINSPKSVSKFFGSLGFHEAAKSAAEGILKEINHPVANDILEMREFKKLRGTYLRPFMAEKTEGKRLLRERGKHIHDDGLVHTKFNHLLTTTGRLSSQDPNMQNLPAREHPDCRGIIKAGWLIGRAAEFVTSDMLADMQDDIWIVSCDEGQIEARVIGMASKDKVLCKSISEGFDIHMEWSERLARRVPRLIGGKANLTNKDIMKKFRSKVKNKWTFPLFYLSTLFSVCQSFDCEERELSPEFERFWDQFSGVKEWQQGLLDFYDDNGYVNTLTGYRRHGPMTRNMIVNSPIQGTAADLVCDAAQRISEHAVKTGKLYLHPRLNVHDDLTSYIPDKFLDEAIDYIAREMVTFDYHFINVPLAVEIKIGRNWGKMKEIAVISSEDYK